MPKEPDEKIGIFLSYAPGRRRGIKQDYLLLKAAWAEANHRSLAVAAGQSPFGLQPHTEPRPEGAVKDEPGPMLGFN
jgi:hypothetical protein